MYHPESLAPHTGKVFEAITKLESRITQYANDG